MENEYASSREMSFDRESSCPSVSTSRERARPSCLREQKKSSIMADYSSVAPPSNNAGGGMNDAFKDALQRARQVGTPQEQDKVKNNVEIWTKKATLAAFSAVTSGCPAGLTMLS